MQQSSQSMNDGLQKMLGELAQMQALPDADVDFLSQMQQVIVGKIRSMLGPPGGGTAGAPGGAQPGMGQPAQPTPAPMGGPAMGLSATGGGGMNPQPNMDELSRVLGGASQAG
jgi:hypothetical protein